MSTCQRRHRHILSLEDHVSRLNRAEAREQDYKDRLHERLNANMAYRLEMGCWVYLGRSEGPDGQIRLRVGQFIYKLGRISAWLYLENFALWDGRYEVVHSCGNYRCFNPQHLVILKGRSRRMTFVNQANARRRQQGRAYGQAA